MRKKIKFINCQIDVSRKVFSPRIETEFWARKAIGEIKKISARGGSAFGGKIDVLDIFAGTGCVGISVLKAIKNSAVDFVDIDKEAIRQIKLNLKINSPRTELVLAQGKISKKRYKIYQSNLFKKLAPYRNGVSGAGYDFILANPPYVATDRIYEVQKEVLEIEPHVALFAGKDGIVYIKKFFDKVKNYLKPRGMIFLEFDPRQKEEIEKILKNQGFKFVFSKDQFGKYRWLKAKIK